MVNYAIIGQIKIKGREAHDGVLSEANRSITGSNVDKKQSHKNIILTKCPYVNYDDFTAQKKEEIKLKNDEKKIWNNQRKENEENKKYRRFPRKIENKKTKEKSLPALSQQFTFTYSPGAMNEEEGVRYLKIAHKFITEWFIDNEVLQSMIHLDETSPHLHVDIAYYNQKECYFNQKELSSFSGNDRTDINVIRDAWQEIVEEEGFDLIKQDGTVIKKEDHEVKADLNKAKLKEEKKVAKYQLSVEQNKNFLLLQDNENLKDKEPEVIMQEIIKEVENPLNISLQYELEQSVNAIEEKDAQIASDEELIKEKDLQLVTLKDAAEINYKKLKKKNTGLHRINKDLQYELEQSVNTIEEKDTQIASDAELIKEKDLQLDTLKYATGIDYEEIKKLKKEINDLKEENEIFVKLPTRESFEKIEKKNTELHRININLQAENEDLKHKEPEVIIKNIKVEVEVENEFNIVMEKEITDLKVKNSDLQTSLDTALLKIEELEKKLVPKPTIGPYLKDDSEIDWEQNQENQQLGRL